MDFARQQRDPRRHLVGLTAVIVFHVLVIWALMTGLAQKAVEVVKKPLSATIVEEIKKPPPPPPPPPKKIIEQPKVQAPVQPYVPPPDIPPPQAPVEAPVIQSTPTPPAEPYVIAPPPPPVVVAPPAPPKPAIQSAFVACPGIKEKITFPSEAIRRGVQRGEVSALLTIDESGSVVAVDIESSTSAMFDRALREGLSGFKCDSQGQKVKARLIASFKLE